MRALGPPATVPLMIDALEKVVLPGPADRQQSSFLPTECRPGSSVPEVGGECFSYRAEGYVPGLEGIRSASVRPAAERVAYAG